MRHTLCVSLCVKMNQVLQFECLFLLNQAVLAITFVAFVLIVRVFKSYRGGNRDCSAAISRTGGFSTVV